MQTWFQRIKWAIFLVLIQVLILNHIHLGVFAVPPIYIYFILKQNSETSTTKVLLWAFVIGLSIDIFSNTPGMNAMASIWAAIIRKPLLKMNLRVDANEAFDPSIRTMGFSSFLGYISLITLIHTLIFNFIDDFSFFRPILVIQKATISSVVTVILILCLDPIKQKKQ